MEPSILLVSLTTGPVPPDTAIVHSLKIRYDLETKGSFACPYYIAIHIFSKIQNNTSKGSM